MATPRSEDMAVSIVVSFEPNKSFVVYNLKSNPISSPS
jgi:hypothetical protein